MSTGGRAIAVSIALVVVMAAFGFPVYVAPRTQTVSAERPVDAVVALGGPIESALYAEQLVKAGASENLVLSEGFGDAWEEQLRICRKTVTSEYRITCFKPEPLTTRGEARGIENLVAQNKWRHIAVVVPKYHADRTRLIVGRCFTGTLDVVTPAGLDTDLRTWVHQYGYQTAAFAKAAVRRGC